MRFPNVDSAGEISTPGTACSSSLHFQRWLGRRPSKVLLVRPTNCTLCLLHCMFLFTSEVLVAQLCLLSEWWDQSAVMTALNSNSERWGSMTRIVDLTATIVEGMVQNAPLHPRAPVVFVNQRHDVTQWYFQHMWSDADFPPLFDGLPPEAGMHGQGHG